MTSLEVRKYITWPGFEMARVIEKQKQACHLVLSYPFHSIVLLLEKATDGCSHFSHNKQAEGGDQAMSEKNITGRAAVTILSYFSLVSGVSILLRLAVEFTS